MQHRTRPECGRVGSRELLRDLGRPQVLAVVIGAMVGTSIYIRPASIAQLVGASTPILIVWVAAGLLTLFGALTYAQLAMRISGAGGEYQFLRATLGALPAFLFGWMRLIIGPAVIAGLAVAFTVFLSDVVPIGSPWVHWNLLWGDRATHVDFGPRQSVALIVILGLAWINTRGVRTAGGFQVAVTLCKVIGLLALIRLHLARWPARLAATGHLVLLEHQDRSVWDHAAIRQAVNLIERAAALRRPGRYQIEAMIAALHCEALNWESTDWPQVLALP